MGKFYIANTCERIIYVNQVSTLVDYVYVYWLGIEQLETTRKFNKWYTYKNWENNYIQVEISPVIAAFYGIEDLCQKYGRFIKM